MNPVSFKPEQQGPLEEFLQIICESRGHAFDPAGRQSDIRNIGAPYQRDGGDFWLVRSGGAVVGTIALKMIDREEGIGEIKRHFVLPALQGQGLGQRLIAHLTGIAMRNGLKILRLDTMKSSSAALAIFRNNGFYEIDKYNDNDVAEIFMEKVLAADLIEADQPP